MSSVSLPDEVRAACAWVAERARSVRIEEDRIQEYAAGFPPPGSADEPAPFADNPETAAAFAVCMNAINFGSGWWPTIRKRPGLSGYGTMAAGVTDRFAAEGPWSVKELRAMDPEGIAEVVDQDPEHPLMPQFAQALRDVGRHIGDDHRGRFLSPTEAADSIPALAGTFAAWDSFADVSRCAVHTIELLAAASPLTPAEIDSTLWNRGRDRRSSPSPARAPQYRVLTHDW